MLGSDSGRLLRPAATLFAAVVGVVVFDWWLQFVLLFYWAEIGLTTLRQTLEATFAGRPNSENGRIRLPAFRRLRTKRGGISMPGPLPPVYPRTAPAVILGGAVSLVVWSFAGTQIVALGGQVDLSAPPLETLLGAPVDSSSLVGLLVGATGLLVGELWTFASNLHTRPYDDLSARAIVGPVQIVASILFLLVFLAGLFSSGGELVAVREQLFAVVVLGRTCVGVLGELDVLERYVPDRLAPDAQVGDRQPVRSGEGEPRTVWRPDRASLLFARVLTSPGRVFGNRAGLLPLVVAAFLWLVLDGAAGVVAAGGLLATVAVIGAVPIVIERDLLHSHLEYRLYDDCLVAHDRLLETPQWRVELAAVRETETGAAFLHRLPELTLERLFVRTDGESRRLVGLTDAESVREAIDTARFE